DRNPAQYQSSGPGSQTGTLRAFSSMNFRLYYSDPALSATTYGQAVGYPGNIPALAAAPAISQISAIPSPDGQSVAFRVNVAGDPSAGIQQVWITYTAATPACSGGPNPCAGQWQPLDLVQDTADSTLWTGNLPLAGTAASDVRYLVQAVNGVGVVGTATNLGAYYVPKVETVSPCAPKQSTTLTLTGGSAHYSDSTGVVATLADQSAPPRRLREQTVMFVVSQGQSSWVVPVITDSLGRAPLGPLPLSPGAYTVAAYFSGTIPVPTSSGVVPLSLTNDRYSASSATLSNGLTVSPEPATAAYTGDTIDSIAGPIRLAAKVTQEADDTPGDITNAPVVFAIKDAG